MLILPLRIKDREKLTSEKKQYYFYLLIATVTAILLASKIDYTLPQYAGIDLFKYRGMAISAPGLNFEIPHPYVYRIFAPWLAGILPFDIDVSFYILNLIGLVILSFVFFEFILSFGIGYKPAFFSTVAFLFNRYFFQFLAFDYFQLSDTISFFLFILSYLLLTKKKYLWIGIVMVTGVLTKEVALLIIPVGYVYLFEKGGGKRDYINFSVVSILAIALFILIRTVIHIETDENYLTQIEYGVTNFFKPMAFIKRFVIAFTPFSVLPFLFFSELVELFKKYFYLLVWLVFAVLSSLFGNDYERLMMPAAPVFFLFLAVVFDIYFFNGKTSTLKNILLFTVVIISLLGSLYHLWGIIRFADSEISLISTVILDILILLIFGYIKISGKNS